MSKPASPLNTQADNSGSTDGMDDMNGPSPSSGSEEEKNTSNMDAGNPDGPSDDMKLIDRPPVNFMPSKKPEFPFLNQSPPDDSSDHSHDDIHDHSHEHDFHDHPPHDYHDHHHDHHHGDIIYDSPPYSSYDDSLKHLHGFDAFPGTFFNILSNKYDLLLFFLYF